MDEEEMKRRIRHSGRVEATEEIRENLMQIGQIRGNKLVVSLSKLHKLIEQVESR